MVWVGVVGVFLLWLAVGWHSLRILFASSWRWRVMLVLGFSSLALSVARVLVVLWS